MILSKIYDNEKNMLDIGQYHIETAMIKSDDLTKRILRVTSDHGHEFGIRLEDDSDHLENGSAFIIGEHNLLVLRVIPDEIIVISPRDMDEMGQIAHMLGNLHKPVQIRDGRISLLYDDVVRQELLKKKVSHEIMRRSLSHAMEYANLSIPHHHHEKKC
jgi:urease accessory protein